MTEITPEVDFLIKRAKQIEDELKILNARIDQVIIPDPITEQEFVQYVAEYWTSIYPILYFCMVDVRCNHFISSQRAQRFPVYSLRLTYGEKPIFNISYANLYNPKYRETNGLISLVPAFVTGQRSCRFIVSQSKHEVLKFVTINDQQWRSLYDNILLNLGATEQK